MDELIDRGRRQLDCGQPSVAIRTARRAARAISDPVTRAINVGGLLIDAGSDLHKTRYIQEAIDKLESISAQVTEPQLGKYHYVLGTGFSALGHRQRGQSPGTRPALGKAISHLDEALRRSPVPEVRANLGRALFAQGRLVEALDEFDAILEAVPTHHQALANRAWSLWRIYPWIESHGAILAGALADIEQAVELARNEPVFQAKYQRLRDKLRRHVSPLSVTPQTSSRRDVQWLWESRLALNPCPLCR